MGDTPTFAPFTFGLRTLAPSLELTSKPTLLSDLYKNARWNDIVVVFYYQVIFGGLLWVVFELCRTRMRNIYSPRKRWDPDKVPAARSTAPLAWVPEIVMMEGKETLDRVGLDAYMLLRFIRLCTRMTLFTSVLGGCILIPVFAQGDEDLTSFNRMTLNNLTKTETMWVSTMLAVVFTAHALFIVLREYQNYVKWRVHWLAEGTIDDARCDAAISKVSGRSYCSVSSISHRQKGKKDTSMSISLCCFCFLFLFVQTTTPDFKLVTPAALRACLSTSRQTTPSSTLSMGSFPSRSSPPTCTLM